MLTAILSASVGECLATLFWSTDRGLDQDLARRNPDDFEAHYLLGTLYRNLGNYDAAEMESRRAVQMKPDGYGARHNLGLVLAKAGKPEDVLPQLQKALEFESGFLGGTVSIGQRVASPPPAGTSTAGPSQVPARIQDSAFPLQRLADVDEVAEVVSFLASERSSYINGQAINVCGGIEMD